MPNAAAFIFHGGLIDFLPAGQSNQPINYRFKESPAVKDAIEALGVPHTEVKYIVVNEAPVGFAYQLHDTDQVDIYGVDIELNHIVSLIPALPDETRFIADVHLGKLARLLRLLGLDCLYGNNLSEHDILTLATQQQRIILTRSIGLLKHKTVQWGYCLRSQHPDEQLKEVIKRYQLFQQFNPFKRCMVCNGLLNPVAKATIETQLLPRTKADFNEYWQCDHCKHVYWKGSHYERMEELVKRLQMKSD